MIKYAKVINEETKQCEVGLGTNAEFYQSIGMTLQDVEQSEKDNQWYLKEYCPHYTPEEKEAIERARKDAMTLTPADVERALYKAKGMDFDDLKALIAQGTGIDLKALAIEFRASNFYRGAKFGIGRLFDVVGSLLGYTPDDIDYLFENKELPEKEEQNEN